MEVHLNTFVPRSYQYPICKAFEEQKYKKILAVLPRRAGKDYVAWNLMIRQALRQIGVYFYCLPTFKQARLVIWDSITNDGKSFLSCIPREVITKINQQEMKVYLRNGSLIQLIGSDTYNTSLVGTNAKMIVFSEYALADPRAYDFVRPLLNANDGSVIVLSTPRSKNHFYALYQIAQRSTDWFCYKLTLDDTKHISREAIEKEIADGEMSEDLALQEYWCSFDRGQEGSIYGKYIDTMRLDNRISQVPWDPTKPVHTAWDLGVRDATAIIFFQVVSNAVHIINVYEQSGVGLEHYIKKFESYPYKWGKHIAPHDIKVREFSTGLSRLEKAASLGIPFIITKNISLEDGIEAVRSTLPRIWIDEDHCSILIKALEAYHYEFDAKRNVYSAHPIHDSSSHCADALRMLCLSLPMISSPNTSPEELDQRYREVMYGDQHNFPAPFNNPRGY